MREKEIFLPHYFTLSGDSALGVPVHTLGQGAALPLRAHICACMSLHRAIF